MLILVGEGHEILDIQHQAIEGVENILQPFVYRRYTDFSIVESLRKLKAMIVQEVRRKNMTDNVKLGAGGIRELEFIAQSFQLVRGGRETQLQERHWLSAMAQLEQAQAFDHGVYERLCEAYVFLRRVEHAIQSYQDQQTQQLPYEGSQQHILAWLFGFADWQAFFDQLMLYRDEVGQQFQGVIASPRHEAETAELSKDWMLVWQPSEVGSGVESGLESELDIAATASFLQSAGYESVEAVNEGVERLRQSWAVRQLSASARQSLDVLVPQIVKVATSFDEPDTTLLRMLEWLEKIVGRSSYVTFLLENPDVLKHLALLFQGSVWIAELLGQTPSLLDELLNTESLYHLPSKAELQDELRLRLLRVDKQDVEATMEVLRYFKLSHCLRVAASDLSERLPLMKISDYLTWIAEVILDVVLSVAWEQLAARHGVPSELTESDGVGDCSALGFLIVAYGKLGGIELSYSSDLDLVFIYQSHAQGMTNGEKPLDNQTFYTRLGQKIIHILNTRTLSGPLYEVDMRLRPSGNSGLLASSITAFTKYQLNDAWTWEHQALVRARPVAGDMALTAAFNDLRHQVLGQERLLSDLRNDVVEMRQKMREHLGSSTSKKGQNTAKQPLFHLKQDAGGIVDIEFMVQYAVLAWGHKLPELMEYTDNVRILERMRSSDGFSADQVLNLIDVYKAYREVAHRLALQKQSSLITEDQFVSYQLPLKRHQVQLLWQQVLCGDIE